MKIKNIYLTIALVLIGFGLVTATPQVKQEREAVPAGGGSAQSSSFKNFSTVGEPVVGSHSSANFSGTTGFLFDGTVPQEAIVVNVGNPYTKTYGEANFTVTYTGGSGTGAVTFSSDDTDVATIDAVTGEVTIVGVGDGEATLTVTKAAEPGKYSQQTGTATLTVEQAPLTVTTNAVETCRGTIPTFTATFSGFVNGETETTLGIAGLAFTPNNCLTVGTFDITPSGLSAAGYDNYEITYAEGTLTVHGATVGGTLAGGTSPMFVNVSTGTLTLSGQTGDVVRWEKRLNAGSWTNIENSASATYSETPTTSGLWDYRALVQNGNCSEVYSSTLSIQVVTNNVIATLSSASAYTNASPFNVSIRFSSSITGLEASDFVVTNGTVGTITPTGEPRTYTVSITPTNTNANVSLYLAASKVKDALLNPNDQSNTLIVLHDNVAPVTADNITSGWKTSDIAVTFTPTDVNGSGVSKVYYTTNGDDPTVSSSFVNLANNYTFTISTSGEYTVKYRALDNAGNLEAVKTAAQVAKLDKVAPSTLVSVPSAIQTTTSGRAQISFTPSDANSGVSKVYYLIASSTTNPMPNPTITSSSVTSANEWKIPATVTDALTDGSYVVKYFVADVAGNQSAVQTATNQYTVDAGIPPTPTASIATVNSVNQNSVQVTIGTPVAVTKTAVYNWEIFNNADPNTKITATGNYAGTSIISQANLSSLADGTLTIKVRITFNNGNSSTEFVKNDIIKETTRPTVTFVRRADPAQNATTTALDGIFYTATFSEAVDYVTDGDFIVTNTGATPTFEITGSSVPYSYTIEVDDYGIGNIVLGLNSLNDIKDTYGNPLVYTSNTATVVYSPEFSMGAITTGSTKTNSSTVQFSMTFSARPIDFTKDKITLAPTATGGTITALETDANYLTWIATVSGMTNPGDIQITIPNSGEKVIHNAQNVALTNTNVISPLVVWDNVAPKIALDATVKLFTPASESSDVETNTNLTVQFDENIALNNIGTIQIRKYADASIVESFDMATAPIGITVVGNNKLQINPTNNLPAYTQVYVTVDGSAIKDVAGNAFAGIDNSVNNNWWFTTKLGAPVAQAGNPTGSKTKDKITLTVPKPVGSRVVVMVKAVTTGATSADDYSNLSFSDNLISTYNSESIDNLLYTATGNAFGTTGYKVVYAGALGTESATNATFTITGLTRSTYYRIFAYAYNSDETHFYYNTVAPGTALIQTNSYKPGDEDDEIGVEATGNFAVGEINPNPVTDQINFKLDAFVGANFSFSVFNMSGQELYTTTQDLTAGLNQINIPVSKLGYVASGSYMIRVSDGNGESMIPFVIHN